MDRENREESHSIDHPTERSVRFKTLTDGLGFHPFADGLPYAPASKTTGTGAVSAGRPQFVYPSPAVTAAAQTASRSTVPLPTIPSTSVDQTVERIRRELDSIQTGRIDQARVIAAQIQDLQSGIKARHSLGYSCERAFAYLLDSAFNLSICASILSTALISTEAGNLRDVSSGALLTALIFLFICNWALLAAQEVAFGTTIGKRIFGLHLNGTGFECFIRSVFFVPSLLFGGLGIMSAIFDPRKRCWHDRATKLQPEN